MTAWWRRLGVRGVLWRKLLRFAVMNTPIWAEPLLHGTCAFFFVLAAPVRRGVMRNLRAIIPGSNAAVNLVRAWRIFFNYACRTAIVTACACAGSKSASPRMRRLSRMR